MRQRNLIRDERAAFHAEEERQLQLRLTTFREGLKLACWEPEEINEAARRYEVVLRAGART